MKHAQSNPVDPNPLMMRGETEFEEARMRCEFELIFKQTAELGIASLKETYEFMFRKAYFTGKAAGKREVSRDNLTEGGSTTMSDTFLHSIEFALWKDSEGGGESRHATPEEIAIHVRVRASDEGEGRAVVDVDEGFTLAPLNWRPYR